MQKALSKFLGRLRVWSAEHAVFWARQVRDCPENELQLLYGLAHKVHLFFFRYRLPWEPGGLE